MTKIGLMSLILLLIVTSIGCAKGYELTKTAGEYSVAVKLDKNPPAVGDNSMTIVVKDASGKLVTDAKLKIEYTMPAMPGMPAMNYTTEAPLQGNEYKATMNLSMAGSWNITLKIFRNDKTETVNFNVDAQ